MSFNYSVYARPWPSKLIVLLLFLYKNKKRGDLVNVWAMGWGWGSLLRSDSLARCEKQKDKRLWTDYSRLDIMHHLRYDGTYRLSWSWVKVLMSIRWCPVCCRDMFHKDLSTATESAAILSTAREMMYFTKTNLKRSYFRFASPPAPPTLERPGHDRFKQLPTPKPEGLELSLWLPEG